MKEDRRRRGKKVHGLASKQLSRTSSYTGQKTQIDQHPPSKTQISCIPKDPYLGWKKIKLKEAKKKTRMREGEDRKSNIGRDQKK